MCDFELEKANKSTCPFMQEEQDKEDWVRVRAEGMIPRTDKTTDSGMHPSYSHESNLVLFVFGM